MMPIETSLGCTTWAVILRERQSHGNHTRVRFLNRRGIKMLAATIIPPSGMLVEGDAGLLGRSSKPTHVVDHIGLLT